jgi:glycosyltransferase involved in cell wall biosynthesis
MTASLITIGLVVRNGERHLREALDSFLAQSFRDFRLCIYDNASEDTTPLIAAEYAQRDRRIHVFRHAHNIGLVSNLIAAVDSATTPYFCWAAHDDLRHAEFLQTLFNALQSDPSAGLACCNVENIDPDGTRRGVRPETLSLCNTRGMSAVRRLALYLRDAPATPFYGLFRTDALREALTILRRTAATDPPLIGIDMLLLSAMLQSHDLAYVNRTLLLFRKGGHSHRIDAYKTLRNYLTHLWRFARELFHIARTAEGGPLARLTLHLACARFLCRYLRSQPMRQLTWHYVLQTLPWLRKAHTHLTVSTTPAFRRLRTRIRARPDIQRVVLMGAGKHTRRHLLALRLALQKRATIVGICDDHASACAPVHDTPIFGPNCLAAYKPDVILVSSDAYEAALYRRAKRIAPRTVEVWCLYEPCPDATFAPHSSSSTEARNLPNSSCASDVVQAVRPDARPT